MTKTQQFIILLALCFVTVSLATDSSVVTLTKENINEILSSNQFVLVEFYAPWCGHCKRLEPEYEKVATALKDENVVIAKVDATIEGELASQYGIQGFPTLKWFINGNEHEYSGPRDAKGIESWVRKRIGPPAQTINSQESLNAFVELPGSKLLAVLDADSTEAKTFLAAALIPDVEDIEFGVIYDSEIASLVRPAATPNSFVLYPANKDPIVSTDISSTEAVIEFVLQHGYPELNPFEQSVFTRAQKSKKPLVAAFVLPDESAADNTELVRQIASQFVGRVIFTIASAEQEIKYAANWGSSGNFFPTLIFIDLRANAVSPRPIALEEESPLTVESGAAFVQGSLDGTVTGFVKSEPIPENNDGPVKVLVGKNFNDIVYNESSDVLVEFYAPWCGHCQKLVPIYEELGTLFHKIPNVVIAKIDATANGFPRELNVRGFPTLYFFKTNDKKQPVLYEGDRSLEHLTQFIVEHSSFDIDLYGGETEGEGEGEGEAEGQDDASKDEL